MTYRLPADLALWGSVAAGVVLGRGQLAAHVGGGTYQWRDAAPDAAAFAAIVVLMRLIDLGLRRLGSPAETEGPVCPQSLACQRNPACRNGAWRRNLAAAARLAFVIFIAFPLVVALANLCPQRLRSQATPAEIGLDYESAVLDSGGLRLSAWHIPAESPTAPVVLIAHGLGVNKAAFLHAARIVHDLGCHVVMFDFRAHGESDGRVTTFGYLEAADVRAAREWIAGRLPGRPVYALGFSLGGAAVLKAAADGAAFDGLMIDSSFARTEEVARASFLRPFGPLRTPAWHLGRFWCWIFSGADLADHEPVRCMAALAGTPVLLIHGTADSIIPCEQSQQLQRAGGGRTQLWLVPRCDHVQAAIAEPEYAGRVAGFLGITASLAK